MPESRIFCNSAAVTVAGSITPMPNVQEYPRSGMNARREVQSSPYVNPWVRTECVRPRSDLKSRYCWTDAAGGVRCLSGEYGNLEAIRNAVP